MMLYIILFIVLILLVCYLCYYFIAFDGIIITDEAKELFIDYIKTHSKSKLHEEKCSELDIIHNIDRYFEIELKEEDHKDIVDMIKNNNNMMDAIIMKKWIKENYKENYIENKVNCD